MSDFKSRIAFFNQKKDDKKTENKKSNANQPTVQKAINSNIKPNEKLENGGPKKVKEQNQKNNITKEEQKPKNLNNKDKDKEHANIINQNNKINISQPNKTVDSSKKIDKKENAPPTKKETTRPVIKDDKDKGQKNLKKEKVKNVVSSVNSEASKIGKLTNGRHPVYGSKKIGEEIIEDDKLDIYDYPLNIEYSSKEKSISILFVGQSGAGKTTFVDILLGLLNPTSGRITVDGVDIASDMRSWQKNLAYVPQSIYLIDGTIKENVALGMKVPL